MYKAIDKIKEGKSCRTCANKKHLVMLETTMNEVSLRGNPCRTCDTFSNWKRGEK